jgi:hypothetical protein
MKILAIIFLTFFSVQEKSVEQETKKTEAPVQKQEASKPEENSKNTKSVAIRLEEAQIQKLIENTSASKSEIVFENGAFYIKTGNFKVPLSGGGASGCITPAMSIEVLKSEPAKVEKENADKPKQK